MDISLVIPVYKSQALVVGSVRRMVRAMEASGRDYEILLRDDGSGAGMENILRNIASKNPRIQCFCNPANEGLGSTLRTLFNDAKGDRVVYCDCDLPFGEHMIMELIGHLERHDVALASRYAGGQSGASLLRRISSRVYYRLCKMLFQLPVVDIGSGTVAVRRDGLDQLTLRAKGFDIHAEFYVQAIKAGLSVTEVPAMAGRSQPGSFSIWRHGPGVVLGTLRLYFRGFKGGIYPEKDRYGWKKRFLNKSIRSKQPAL